MKISEYWGKLQKTKSGWVHPDDLELLRSEDHSFNLDFPPPAFVGNVVDAKIIVLAANGGYHPTVTPSEFEASGAEAAYIDRLSHPGSADWSAVAPYYNGYINYASMLLSGEAAIVNACAYRSPKISEEPANRKLIKRLPSVAFQLRWLVECVLPDAEAGKRLIVGKRQGLWRLPARVKESKGYIRDPAPVSPHLSRVVQDRIAAFGSERNRV